MCGNWGLLCLAEFAAQQKKRGEPFPDGLEKLIRALVGVIEMRGAQAGGFNVMLPGPDMFSRLACRNRVLKPKRGDLCDTLFAKFKKSVKWQSRLGALKSRLSCCGRLASKPVLVQGHSRFGTSSAPAVDETHPHQWSPTTQVTHWLWDVNQLRWRSQEASYSLVITHNGDFDAWRPFRETTVGLGALALWLDRVLGCRNWAAGDSPKAAGVLELLVCQGVWLHSVRLAFHLYVACHVEQSSGWEPLTETAPRTVPDKKTLGVWADVFEKEFASFINDECQGRGSLHPLAPESGLLEKFIERVEAKLKLGASGKLLKQWVPDASVSAFLSSACDAFRDNDILHSAMAFFDRAVGTFGMSVTSTLQPDTVVLAARGQPMSVGFGGQGDGHYPLLSCWSSEPAALTLAAKQAIRLRMAVRTRFDLDDQHGEILQLRIRNGDTVDESSTAFPVVLDQFGELEQPKRGKGAPQGPAKPSGTYLEMWGSPMSGTHGPDGEHVPPTVMSASTFQHRLLWLEVEKEKAAAGSIASLKTTTTLSVKDFVIQDLEHTPGKIAEIDLSWTDLKCKNRKVADVFCRELMRVLVATPPSESDARHIDLLVTGVESSLWLAQQFCADLTRLFPRVHAVAMSSNIVLGLLQSGPGHLSPGNWVYHDRSFEVTKRTICLVVSHSGTTYPTVWAARHLCSRSPYVFGMAGSFDCLLANSIRQAQREKEDPPPRFFSTFAGVRTAEAATLTTVAMHHTFSHLLLSCASMATGAKLPSLHRFRREDIVNGVALEDNHQETCGSWAPMCSASADDVLDMQRLVLTMLNGSAHLIGVDGRGNKLPADELHVVKELRRMGHRWSHHITESYWATFVPAAYVILTVVSGIIPATWIATQIFDAVELEEVHEYPGDLVWYGIRAIDAFLYVFMGIIVACIHRLCTRRRFWARFTTRTVAIVETTVNYKLLRAYVSKLLALSWRFAGLGVIGQNGTDHFVHEYTHKAQSDVLVAVGLPDGRLPSVSSAEACTMMSLQQAKFIKQKGKGIEALSIGHNRYERPGVFSERLQLPTNRPIFASELKLLPEQLSEGSDTIPGEHGLPPTTIAQRWGDLLREGMDPNNMHRVHLGLEELKARIAPKKSLTKEMCVELLAELLRDQLGDAGQAAPLGLNSFLDSFFGQDPHASLGGKEATPSGQYKRQNSKEKASKPGNVTSIIEQNFTSADGGDAGAGEDGGDAVMRKITARLSQVNTPTTGKPKATTSVVKETLEPHEFMALLHGDELQTWFRITKGRWGKIRSIRGLMCTLAHDDPNTPLSAVMFAGGIGLATVLNSWRRVTKVAHATSKADSHCITRTVSGAASVHLDTAETAHKVGEHLLEQDMSEAKIIRQCEVIESFHESRVGSCERLISWFVLFHAMAKPASRLPVLRFDLGKSESRLRVASTPAPVPNHEPPEEYESDVEDSAEEEAGRQNREAAKPLLASSTANIDNEKYKALYPEGATEFTI